MIVVIVGAYVDGLPIPNSSNFLTSEASVNLEGGLVNLCVDIIDFGLIVLPLTKFGSNGELKDSLSNPSK